jgi:transposase
MEFISFDSHKRYTVSIVEDKHGRIMDEARIQHVPGALCGYLGRFTPGSPVAVETIGNWYWIVDEIEAAGMKPLLVHARKAKLMSGNVNKTDRIDARALNRLQRAGTLPTVWIPPGDLRDKRDLPRTRMYLVHQRTCLKNRLSSALARYALTAPGVRYSPKSRPMLNELIARLPDESRMTARLQLGEIDRITEAVETIDARMREVFDETEDVRLLRTIPGVGFLFSIVISLEVGDISRFHSSSGFASYAGTTPRVHSSGGKTRYGTLRNDVNRYLKWTFMEAGNIISMLRRHYPTKHVCRKYTKIRNRKGHAKAVGAVARHLAEAAYWVLTKKEEYMDPGLRRQKPTEA